MIQDVITILHTDLVANINTRLLAQDSKYSDFTLVPFKDRSIYKGSVSEPYDYPCIFIEPISSPIENEIFTNLVHRSHNIDIIIILSNQKDSEIMMRMARTLRAAQNVVENITASGGLITWKVLDLNYNAFEFSTGNNISRAGVLTVQAIEQEQCNNPAQV